MPPSETSTPDDQKINLKDGNEQVTACAPSKSESGASANQHVVERLPDGGIAWVMALNGLLLVFSTFGFANSWVFQEYYGTTILKTSSPSAISWIASIQYFLIFLPSAFVGRLLDRGHLRLPLLISSIIFIASVFSIAQCKKYWQFMLVQGVILGLSGGFVFGPSISLMNHWFKRRRATAYGLVAAGASVGGTVFPILIRNLIPKIGFPWTIRVVGFIMLLTVGLPNLVVRLRLPPQKVNFGLFSIVAFKSVPYSLLVAGVFIGFLGIYTVLTYIDVAGVSVGLNPNFSFYLVAIANAASGVGRLGAGVLGDYIGQTNTLIPLTLVGAITTFAWPFCISKASSVALAVIYGAASGAFIGLMGTPVARFGGTEDLGRRTGMLYTIGALGALIGPPISGAIHDTYGGFHQVSIYAGCTIIASALLILGARQASVGRLWVKV
ncbi:hypothetical protein BOTBODRAFT_179205 [Botryobasidium botryosum FD-172 SS1]|uniref:Major facilitator superfamily (MFS) profile domain-containing protein n=1 Tax=Botryobasidium botryosum (strain FD-172 SS1) TaxID=930990 RepID=A0A067M0U6_BOTB1|nr:hypothetical protein BOTBODRAFT_179205 [Botryobasidium botryosum FD-172 SS1]